jgi:hypothetical protein
MMGKTISMSVGRVAIYHDIRKEISANVDPSLTKNNVIFIDKLAEHSYSVESYTNAKFQPYIDLYNIGKKNCRQIHCTYTEYLAKQNEKINAKKEANKNNGIKRSVRNTTKLCHEYVLQVGDRDSNGVKNADIAKNREYCQKVLKDIQDKYKHVDVLLATYHVDEPNGTPHMHILVQFTGEGYQRGLGKQISMSKALELDGFERSQNRGDYAINRWTKDIQDTIMTDRLHEVFNEEREILNEGRKHDDIKIFREKAKAEAEALDQKRIEAERAEKELIDRHNELSESVSINEGLNLWYADQNEHLQNENDELKKTVQLKEKEIDFFNEKISKLIDKKKSLIANCRFVSGDLVDLQGKISKGKNQLSELENQSDCMKKIYENYKVEADEMQKKLESTSYELVNAKIRVAAVKSELEPLLDEKKALLDELEPLRDELNYLTEKSIPNAKKELVDTKNEVKKWQHSLDQLKGDVTKILNSVSENFKKILKLHATAKIQTQNATELTEKTKQFYSDKIDKLDGDKIIKEKSKAIINDSADEVQEIVRRRRRGR